MAAGLLGCGTHRAAIYDRDTGKVADLDGLAGVSWSRVMDTHSTATVTVGRSASCCAWLENVRSWRHELVVSRNGRLVWQGPIVKSTYSANSTEFEARDRWAWLDRREIRDALNLTGDLSDIARDLIEHGLRHPDGAPDETGILKYADIRPSTVTGNREYKASSESVGSAIRKLAGDSGLNVTFLGKRLLVFGPSPLTKLKRLQDKDFLDELTVTENGLAAATRVTVKGKSVRASAGGTDPYYGLLEVVVNDQAITDYQSALNLAIVEASTSAQPPLVVSVPDGVQLSPDAPTTVDELIPGAGVSVWSTRTCRKVDTEMALVKVAVSEEDGAEKVAVTLEPSAILTGATEERRDSSGGFDS